MRSPRRGRICRPCGAAAPRSGPRGRPRGGASDVPSRVHEGFIQGPMEVYGRVYRRVHGRVRQDGSGRSPDAPEGCARTRSIVASGAHLRGPGGALYAPPCRDYLPKLVHKAAPRFPGGGSFSRRKAREHGRWTGAPAANVSGARIGGVPKRSNGADCKSAGISLRGFESLPAHHKKPECTSVIRCAAAFRLFDAPDTRRTSPDLRNPASFMIFSSSDIVLSSLRHNLNPFSVPAFPPRGPLFFSAGQAWF